MKRLRRSRWIWGALFIGTILGLVYHHTSFSEPEIRVLSATRHENAVSVRILVTNKDERPIAVRGGLLGFPVFQVEATYHPSGYRANLDPEPSPAPTNGGTAMILTESFTTIESNRSLQSHAFLLPDAAEVTCQFKIAYRRNVRKDHSKWYAWMPGGSALRNHFQRNENVHYAQSEPINLRDMVVDHVPDGRFKKQPEVFEGENFLLRIPSRANIPE